MIKQVKEKFLKFFELKDHYNLESYSLIPKNDPTLMFINSGMAPMKKYFLNESVAPYKNIVTIQKCLRVGGKHNDLQDVGYTKRHHTFFEMLGNFSFGGYFKETAIKYAWEFLTKELNLDETRLYVTIHPKDEEALKIWKTLISIEKIIFLKNNEWSMGDVGPFGYCSEIFYDLKYGSADFENEDRYLEIWNLVFMQFCKDENSNYELPQMCIDTGMGLERIVSILENKIDTYDINFFTQLLGLFNLEHHNPHTKIILDHIRSIAFLIEEGIRPSANNEGYVLRRLIRRMLRSVNVLKLSNFLIIAKEILNVWSNTYSFNIDKIIDVLATEQENFEKTLNEGLKHFNIILQNTRNFCAQDIYVLHDRYGLSIDIVCDLLKENDAKGDFEGFEKILEQNKLKININLEYPNTEVNHEAIELEAELIGIYENYLIFNKTPFYAESGGQIGDTGTFVAPNFKVNILDTKKNNKIIIHEYEIEYGSIEVGLKGILKIDEQRRNKISIHHSCVHLSQHALDHLYEEVQQMGSYVSENKFRLDFSWNNNYQLDPKLIEQYIATLIDKKIDTQIEYMELNKAKATGAKAFFKYDQIVRVVKIGPAAELCAGTHIKNTTDVIGVKILKISSLQNGIKRIEGIAGKVYLDYLKQSEEFLNNVCEYLKCEKTSLINTVKKLKNVATSKELKILKKETKNNQNIALVLTKDVFSIEEVMSKEKLHIACLIIEKDEKISLILKTTCKMLNAKETVKKMAEYINAKGAGGNENFAQTGGNRQNNYDKIFEILIQDIK